MNMDNYKQLEEICESLWSKPKGPEDVVSHYISKVQGNLASARTSLELLKHGLSNDRILSGALQQYETKLQELASDIETHFVKYFSKK